MRLPSVLLHDHLDGGLRPGTVLDLAKRQGYHGLPFEDPVSLAAWFDQSESGSLESYLAAFEHTIAVMQTPEALERVAYEAVVDLAADGVVYAEIRFSPPLHGRRGMSSAAVLEAVSAGMRLGERETGLKWGLIVDALRQSPDSEQLARLAVESRGLGVVGFDIAGPEAGYPPTDHLGAFRLARQGGLMLTIHAGEHAGIEAVSYVKAAVETCEGDRIGHGIELIQDCIVEEGEVVKLGSVADMILSRQVPLEMCPASNRATNRLEPDDHPIGAMYRAGFNVTINTDNRLMSATSMSQEFAFVTEHHGFTVQDLAATTRRSLDAAFCASETKGPLWEDVIAPAYAAAGAEVESVWL